MKPESGLVIKLVLVALLLLGVRVDPALQGAIAIVLGQGNSPAAEMQREKARALEAL